MWQTADSQPGCSSSAVDSDNFKRELQGKEGANSKFDSCTDSGFLSGSNLGCDSGFLSGPIEDEERSPQSEESMRKDTGRINKSLGSKKSCEAVSPSNTRLDSGIDLAISEQLSVVQLCSQEDSGIAEGGQDDSLCEGGREMDSKSQQSLNVPKTAVSLLREVFQRDSDGDTELHTAVCRGFVEVVYRITRLLPHQAFLDIPNNNGKTALHLAASCNSGIARHLLVCGASPVARDRRGNTPLHLAAKTRDATLLHNLTASVTSHEVVSARLQYTPSPIAGILAADFANYEGETVLHVAVKAGDAAMLRHLVWYGADVNATEGRGGRSPLHYAVANGDDEMVHCLLSSCGADPTVLNYQGLTAYQLALANGHTQMASLLMRLGSPAQPLPSHYFTDSDEDSDDFEEMMAETTTPQMDDELRFDDVCVGGLPMSTGAFSPIDCAPISTADLCL